MRIDGIGLACRSQDEPYGSSARMRQVDNCGVFEEVGDRDLISRSSPPDLRHDARGGHQRGIGLDEASSQAHHDLVAPLEGNECTCVENDAGAFGHAAPRRDARRVKRLNNALAF